MPILTAFRLSRSPSFEESGLRGRAEYLKADADTFHFVIYDRTSTGESFAEHEPGETCWYDFDPSEDERQVARLLLLLGWCDETRLTYGHREGTSENDGPGTAAITPGGIRPGPQTSQFSYPWVYQGS